MADGPIRRKSEKAVRDRAGVPVLLFYDEANDKTVMARSTSDGNLEVVETDGYWNQWRYAYDVNGNLEYKGLHKVFNALTSDTSYWITKYSYDVNQDLERKQRAEGSWDGKAGLGW